MINNFTTIHAVISKVVRDFGIADQEVRWQDMIEWVSEGLILIGSYYQFKEKEAIIAIENHKGVLPCDFYKSIRFLEGCSLGNNYNGPYWSVVNKALKESGYQKTEVPCTVNNGNCYDVIDMHSFQKLQLVQYKKVGYFDQFMGNLKRVDGNLIGKGLTYTGVSNAYSVNMDSITAGFRYGFIALRYLAIPVDSCGYPLVPDHPSFMEALMWRCAEKLAMRGIDFPNKEFNNFEVAKFYWNKYCLQARGEANAPDPDMLQRLSNIWRSLPINYDQYYNDFNNLGEQNVYNFNGRE